MFVLFITALLLLIPANVLAASKLIVSADFNFSSQTMNFASNQNIFVKLESDAPSDGIHQLNLRDNRYGLIQSYNLVKNQNNFTASLTAPSAQGYYSLEAVIESQGTSIKSVKTIKVGSPQNADIKVNVRSQNGNSNTNIDSNTESQSTQNESKIESSPQTSQVPAPEKDQVKNESLIGAMFSIFKAVFAFLWPF